MTTSANRGLSRRAAIGGVAALGAAAVIGGKNSSRAAAAVPLVAAPTDPADSGSPEFESWLLETCPDPEVRLSLADVVAT